MTPTRKGWRSLLSTTAFLGGLSIAAIFAVSFDGGASRPTWISGLAEVGPSLAPARALGPQDRADAALAWRYIQDQTDPVTGLVRSVSDYGATTWWDQGSYLMALIAAERLDLITTDQAASRAAQFMTSLARLPLYDGRLPNKANDVSTLAMTDYEGAETPEGIGWSVLDMARLLLGLRIVGQGHPDLQPQIMALVGQWDLAGLTDQGELMGAFRDERSGETVIVQEGRVGYEQYAARALALYGLDTARAITIEDDMALARVSGVEIVRDARTAARFSAITPVLSEPYLLIGFELGLGAEDAALAARLLQAQEARSEAEGQPVLVSEDHLDQAPYFAYHAIWGNGRPWTVLSETGERFPDLATLSTKAAHGWDALYDTPFTAAALARIRDLAQTDEGWAAGVYLRDGAQNTALTLNTNAIILEALHYKAFGPLLGALP